MPSKKRKPASKEQPVRCHVCQRVIGYHRAPERGRQFGATVSLPDVAGRGGTYPDGTLMLRCREHEHVDPAEWVAQRTNTPERAQ